MKINQFQSPSVFSQSQFLRNITCITLQSITFHRRQHRMPFGKCIITSAMSDGVIKPDFLLLLIYKITHFNFNTKTIEINLIIFNALKIRAKSFF